MLVARELFLLVAGPLALRRGVELKINWWGRLAVWPTMSRDLLRAGRPADRWREVLLYIGLALSLMAPASYARDALTRDASGTLKLSA